MQCVSQTTMLEDIFKDYNIKIYQAEIVKDLPSQSPDLNPSAGVSFTRPVQKKKRSHTLIFHWTAFRFDDIVFLYCGIV